VRLNFQSSCVEAGNYPEDGTFIGAHRRRIVNMFAQNDCGFRVVLRLCALPYWYGAVAIGVQKTRTKLECWCKQGLRFEVAPANHQIISLDFRRSLVARDSHTISEPCGVGG
jgi:hypothetical protein